MPQMKVETVVQKFVELRDKRAALKRAFEAEDFLLKQGQEKIEAYLLKRLTEEGVDSFKTAEGTAYTALETKVSCADWGSIWQWMAVNGEFSMMEKRLAVSAVKDYEERTGNLPPYVNKMVEKVVRVRRG